MGDELIAYGSISFVYENGAEFTEGSGNGFAVDVTVNSVFAGQTLTVDLATAGDIHTATFPGSVQVTIDQYGNGRSEFVRNFSNYWQEDFTVTASIDGFELASPTIQFQDIQLVDTLQKLFLTQNQTSQLNLLTEFSSLTGLTISDAGWMGSGHPMKSTLLNNPDQAIADFVSVSNVVGNQVSTYSGSFLLAADGTFDHSVGEGFGGGVNGIADGVLWIEVTDGQMVQDAFFYVGRYENYAPVVVGESITITEDAIPVVIDVLGNDYDPNHFQTITLSNVTVDQGGQVQVVDGLLTYEAVQDFDGTEIITYTVRDEEGLTATGQVTVEVTPIQDAPAPVNDSFVIAPNTATSLNVLANDVDVDGDSLSVVALLPEIKVEADLFALGASAANYQLDVLQNDIDPSGHGLTLVSASVSGSGSVTVDDDVLRYTPAADFEGIEVGSYVVSNVWGMETIGTFVASVSGPSSLDLSSSFTPVFENGLNFTEGSGNGLSFDIFLPDYANQTVVVELDAISTRGEDLVPRVHWSGMNQPLPETIEVILDAQGHGVTGVIRDFTQKFSDNFTIDAQISGLNLETSIQFVDPLLLDNLQNLFVAENQSRSFNLFTEHASFDLADPPSGVYFDGSFELSKPRFGSSQDGAIGFCFDADTRSDGTKVNLIETEFVRIDLIYTDTTEFFVRAERLDATDSVIESDTLTTGAAHSVLFGFDASAGSILLATDQSLVSKDVGAWTVAGRAFEDVIADDGSQKFTGYVSQVVNFNQLPNDLVDLAKNLDSIDPSYPGLKELFDLTNLSNTSLAQDFAPLDGTSMGMMFRKYGWATDGWQGSDAVSVTSAENWAWSEYWSWLGNSDWAITNAGWMGSGYPTSSSLVNNSDQVIAELVTDHPLTGGVIDTYSGSLSLNSDGILTVDVGSGFGGGVSGMADGVLWVEVTDGSQIQDLFYYVGRYENSAPDAVDDTVDVLVNSVNLIDVLANDLDSNKYWDFETLEIVSASSDGAGQVSIDNQQLVYAPADDFVGQEIITYTIQDASGVSDTAYALAQVGSVTHLDSGADVNLSAGEIIYMPATDFTGADSFYYVMSDGTESLTARVEIYTTIDRVISDVFHSVNGSTFTLSHERNESNSPVTRDFYLSQISAPDGGLIFDQLIASVDISDLHYGYLETTPSILGETNNSLMIAGGGSSSGSGSGNGAISYFSMDDGVLVDTSFLGSAVGDALRLSEAVLAIDHSDADLLTNDSNEVSIRRLESDDTLTLVKTYLGASIYGPGGIAPVVQLHGLENDQYAVSITNTAGSFVVSYDAFEFNNGASNSPALVPLLTEGYKGREGTFQVDSDGPVLFHINAGSISPGSITFTVSGYPNGQYFSRTFTGTADAIGDHGGLLNTYLVDDLPPSQGNPWIYTISTSDNFDSTWEPSLTIVDSAEVSSYATSIVEIYEASGGLSRSLDVGNLSNVQVAQSGDSVVVAGQQYDYGSDTYSTIVKAIGSDSNEIWSHQFATQSASISLEDLIVTDLGKLVIGLKEQTTGANEADIYGVEIDTSGLILQTEPFTATTGSNSISLQFVNANNQSGSLWSVISDDGVAVTIGSSAGYFTPNNSPPVIDSLSVNYDEDSGPQVIDISSIVDDPDNDSWTVVNAYIPGSLSLVSVDGTELTYTSALNAFGDETLVFVVEDQYGKQSEGQIEIYLNALPDDPIAEDFSIYTPISSSVSTDLSNRAFDPDGDAVTITINQPSSGAASLNGTLLTYTPSTLTSSGSDSLTYTVTSGGVQTQGTVTFVNAGAAEILHQSVDYESADSMALIEPSHSFANARVTQIVPVSDSIAVVIWSLYDGSVSNPSQIYLQSIAQVNGSWTAVDEIYWDVPGSLQTIADPLYAGSGSSKPALGLDGSIEFLVSNAGISKFSFDLEADGTFASDTPVNQSLSGSYGVFDYSSNGIDDLIRASRFDTDLYAYSQAQQESPNWGSTLYVFDRATREVEATISLPFDSAINPSSGVTEHMAETAEYLYAVAKGSDGFQIFQISKATNAVTNTYTKMRDPDSQLADLTSIQASESGVYITARDGWSEDPYAFRLTNDANFAFDSSFFGDGYLHLAEAGGIGRVSGLAAVNDSGVMLFKQSGVAAGYTTQPSFVMLNEEGVARDYFYRATFESTDWTPGSELAIETSSVWNAENEAWEYTAYFVELPDFFEIDSSFNAPIPNATPNAVVDEETVLEDSSGITIDVLANDFDDDLDILYLVDIDTTGISGTARIDNGEIFYAPASNFSGLETVTYTISDGIESVTGTVKVNVTPVNDGPIAQDDTFGVIEDDSVTQIFVTSNDSDVDGDDLIISVIDYSGDANVAINADNKSIDYEPASNFAGTETIAYTVSDGYMTDTAVLTVTVASLNDAPVSNDDFVEVMEDASPTKFFVLNNDSDADLDAILITDVSTPDSGGTVSISGDSQYLEYQPAADFFGTERFVYSISDGFETVTSSVVVTVSPINDPPLALNDSFDIIEDSPFDILNVLSNDFDADGDSLALEIVSAPSSGASLTLWSEESLVQQALNGLSEAGKAIVGAANFSPYDLNYRWTSGSDPVVELANPANTSAEFDALSAADQAIVANFTLSNPDNDEYNFYLIDLFNQALIYSPPVDFFGVDTFEYRISDGNGGVSTASVSITVSPVNDAPSITSLELSDVTIAENTSIGTVVFTVVAADPESDPIVFSLSDGDAADFVIDPNSGDVRFAVTPDYEAKSVYSFNVTASDGNDSSTGSVTVNISDIDEFDVGALVDVDDTSNLISESAVSGAYVGIEVNASDLDGTDSILYSLSDSAGGRFTIDETTGVVTVANADLIDFETNPYHSIGVQALSSDGSSSIETFVVNLADETDPYVDLNQPMDIYHLRGGVYGGTGYFGAYDVTPNDDVYGSLFEVAKSSDGIWYRVEGGRGDTVWHGNNGATLAQRFNDPYYENTITAGTGYYADRIDEVFYRPPISYLDDQDDRDNFVLEVSSIGDEVGVTGYAKNFDNSSEVLTYALSDSAGGIFAIDATTGIVTVADPSLLDYQATSLHTIEIVASSALGDTSAREFTIEVNPRPIAVDDFYEVLEDYPLTQIPVLSNDIDVDTDDLIVSVFDYTGDASVAINANAKSIDYTPTSNFSGTETIAYTVSDGYMTDTAVLTITVAAVNDAPIAVADSFKMLTSDASILMDVLGNDADVDNDLIDLTLGEPELIQEPIELVVTAAGGKYFIDSVEQAALTLAPGSTYIFDYSAVMPDSGGINHPLKFSTTSDGIFNGGVFFTEGVTEFAGYRVQIDVTETTPDLYYFCWAHPEMGSSAFVSESVVNNGTVSVVDNQLLYTPPPDFMGEVQLQYRVEDPDGLFDTGFVTITVDDQYLVSVTPLGSPDSTTASNYNEFDYLDLRSLVSLNADGDQLSGELVYDLNVDLGDLAPRIITVGDDGANSYNFEGFEGFIVAGSSTSSLDDLSTTDVNEGNPITISGASSENDVVVVADGSGLSIDLGSDAGSESDVLSFRSTNAGVDINLNNTDANGFVRFTTVDGESEVRSADVIFGSEGDDRIIGHATNDNLIHGGSGNDYIEGGSGNDILHGGLYDDTLIGGAGDDVLIDLGYGTADGGLGKDIFSVRGKREMIDLDGDGTTETTVGDGIADALVINNIELASDALKRGGLNSDAYTDRIVFSLSTSAIAAIAAADTTIAWPLDTSDTEQYISLRNMVDLEVNDISAAAGTATGTTWEINASINYRDGGVDASALLGRAMFTVSNPVTQTDGQGSTIEAKVLAQADFMQTIHDAVLDQMLYSDDALAVANAGGGVGSDSQSVKDYVYLTVGLYTQDANLVELPEGATEGVLVPFIINGQEVATRFQSSNADEVLVGGRSGDSYEFVPSEFTDSFGDLLPAEDQKLGEDMIVERGIRGADVSDDVNRDKIEFADEASNTGLSINDFMDYDQGLGEGLSLSRTQIGREGDHRSLEITYVGDKLNDVDVGLYKQYYEYNDAFRVEDIQLLGFDEATVVRYDLGVTDTSGNLSTSGARDAILIGRDGQADVFTIHGEGVSGVELDIILADMELLSDSVDITDFGFVVDAVDYSAATAESKVSVTMNNGTIENTADDVTLNFYFTDTAPLSDDDWLLMTQVA